MNINYITDEQTTQFIMPILNLFKRSDYQGALKIITEQKINPQYSENILSDYAALWLKEPEIIAFFQEIKKLGGKPTTHHTILQNVIKGNKNQALEYLLENKALEHCLKDRVYIINAATMSVNIEALDILSKHLKLTDYYLQDETNPSMINRALSGGDHKMMAYLFDSHLIDNHIFNDETITMLFEQHHHQTEKDLSGYIHCFITLCSNLLHLQDKSFSYIKDFKGSYEPDDMKRILKIMQYDSLDKNLSVKSGSFIKRKI